MDLPFSPATSAWFEASFAAPTVAQSDGWKAIGEGTHTLIHAPTGSGKTLAAFLWALDGLLHAPVPARADRCRVLYISPLKALAYDVERNLRAPLRGIRHAATRLELDELPEITTSLRTGDTPANERQRMRRTPPDILITTPESLFLLLTSEAREFLRSVETVIVDEVHAVAGTKRGAHLSLSLERLEEICHRPPQRIGLSATQRPLETIGRFLAGGETTDDIWRPRPVTIVDDKSEKELDINIVVPVEDMTAPAPLDGDPSEPQDSRSIWPAVYPRILETIKTNTSTIVFANSRRLAERLSNELNRIADEPLTRAHHGSVAREQRVEIEEALKGGTLPAVVATSTLELGIDMGAVDHVVQVEAPISVASGLQRVGRAGHQVGATSAMTIFPKYRGDLLVSTVVADLMRKRLVEATRIPRNPLDVLAQHIVAMVAIDTSTVDKVFEVVRRAAPYAELGRGPFEATLDMLAGRYPSDLFAELRPRITWDRVTGALEARPGAQRLAVQNAGTIPDRGLYIVTLPEGGKVGELDEEMVYESRIGDVFLLGTTAWKITDITHDRVIVLPAPGAPGAKMPFWHGDQAGRPLATGRALGAFVREIGAADPKEAGERLQTEYRLDAHAARNLVAYITEEKETVGALPTDRTIVIERFRDEIGDWRLVLLSPFGAKVHAPWAMALGKRFAEQYGHDPNVIWADDGIAFRFPDTDEPPNPQDLLIDPEDVEAMVVDRVAESALFAARFREAAARALLLPRRRPGSRTPLWLQRRKSADLLSVAREFGSFPIMLETYREILQDDFDLPALIEVLGDIRSRTVRVVEMDVDVPSPFAASLLFSFIAAYLYEADTPLAERRAAALTLDRDLLRELLGEGELRELLSADVVATIELELQRLADGYRTKGAEGVADLLRMLGPLTTTEVDVRTEDAAIETLAALQEARRIIPVTIAGTGQWAIIEDASRLRDGLGVQMPPGVPHTFLEPVVDPLGDLIGRYARTHGPFTNEHVAERLGLPIAVVDTTLQRLEAAGRVTAGEFRPGGRDREWVDNEVLRRLKRRSLAVLRKEIEPTEPAALARLSVTWNGLTTRRRPGAGPLLDAVRRLQGAVIPASVLETDVLAGRVDYSPGVLDQLMVTGDVVWMGRGTLGSRDGKLALYLRERLPLLTLPSTDEPLTGKLHEAIRQHLTHRGASFFRDLYEAVGGGDPSEALEALWDLVWHGEITNDTLAPVRALLTSRPRKAAKGRPSVSSSFPPSSAGRWYLVSDLVGTLPEPTARATAWADQLLDRHGVLTRRAVLGEGFPGGFSALYPVLSHMEDIGKVRRGYFVEGLGGSQFALPGAVDRLRTDPADLPILVAATDPANPYGAALDWPPHEHGRASRSAGAYVILSAGKLIAYVENRKVLTFTTDVNQLGEAAGQIAEAGRRRSGLRLLTSDDEPISQTPLGGFLKESGFVLGHRGLTYRHA